MLVNNWISLIKLLDIRLSIPRHYFVDKDLLHVYSVRIHGFCDASQDSYAALIYITTIINQNDSRGNFVLSKTKAAPLKRILSIPKLELIACLLLSQSVQKVTKILQGSVDVNIVCWSDSLDALYWIKFDLKKRPI